jgi:sodium pump decarboxylase gamma subunit
MNTVLSQGLLITLVGMGLVFLALILMWWLMDILVRLFSESDVRRSPDVEAEVASPPLPEEQELRRRAAVAAVALALHFSQRPRTSVMPSSPSSVTPWQIADRLTRVQHWQWTRFRKPRGGAK